MRKQLKQVQCLSFFDPKAKIVIRTDASGTGLGAVLIQHDRPVMFISRRLTDTEMRYSQIEREFLGIVYALYRFKSFICGKTVLVETDNKPLISFFKQDIDKLPLRVQRWMLLLQPFDFELMHIAGRENLASDSLSRCPCDDTSVEAESSNDFVCLILTDFPLSISEFCLVSETDCEMQELKTAITSGWSKNESLIAYNTVKNQLSVDDNGLVMFRDRIVVPKSLRAQIIRQAHEGHVGAEKIKISLRSRFFWPKMSTEIDDHVRTCEACVINQVPNRHAPLKPVADEAPCAWDTIAIDFTGNSERLSSNILLTIIDFYSRYPYVYEVKTCSSSEAIRSLSHLFSMVGFPRKLVSDNGTAFISQEFCEFMKKCGIDHVHSSVYYPQSNGTIERFHGTLKSRIDKMLTDGISIDVAIRQALFDIRSLPNISTGQSPFLRFFGREMPTR